MNPISAFENSGRDEMPLNNKTKLFFVTHIITSQIK